MQKSGLAQQQIQTTKLSPQQIQFIKLLQIPTAELDARIKEELSANPVLEEGVAEAEDADLNNQNEAEETPPTEEDPFDDRDLNLEDYLQNDDIAGYKMQGDGPNPDEEDREMPLAMQGTLSEALITQLGYLGLDDRKYQIGLQLIGSLESDGYVRRDLESIANDLAFAQNIATTPEEVEEILLLLQEQLDPPGIAARNLQECLVRQLERKRENHEVASLSLQVLETCFDEFSKRHYDKIQRKLGLADTDLLREAIQLITRLNPKPGEVSAASSVQTQYITPDFILHNQNGRLELRLNGRNAPELRISRSYSEMLDTYDKSDRKDKSVREAATFVKQKLDAAKWFIDAIRQRQQTLLRTMNAILEYQRDYFLDGDESKLQPMILKDIADRIGMDISTVSRVASSKYIQTEFGVFALRHFFSEGIATASGEEVSSREVKSVLRELIEQEDRTAPLSDDKLEQLLRERHYVIARRTVAKYREQLGIPVARLRREL